MSLDPIGFDAGDPNLYRYVGNNPTNGVDPSGLEEKNVVKPVVEGIFLLPFLAAKAVAPAETGQFIQGFEDRTRGALQLFPVADATVKVAEGKPLLPDLSKPLPSAGDVALELLKTWSDFTLAPFRESGKDTAATWTAVTQSDFRPLAYRSGARTFDGLAFAATEGGARCLLPSRTGGPGVVRTAATEESVQASLNRAVAEAETAATVGIPKAVTDAIARVRQAHGLDCMKCARDLETALPGGQSRPIAGDGLRHQVYRYQGNILDPTASQYVKPAKAGV
jgi:hypothetical protein